MLAGWQKPLDFSSQKKYRGMASGRAPGKIARHVEGPGTAEINWYSEKERRTSRLSSWRTHERSRIFGGHGCGLGGGRKTMKKDRPENEISSETPRATIGGARGGLGGSRRGRV